MIIDIRVSLSYISPIMRGGYGMKVKSSSRQPAKKNNQYARTPPWSEPSFRQLADNIMDGVYCINTDGYFTFLNKAIIEQYNISPDKIHATHFLDVVHPTYHDLASQNFQRVISGENGIPYEFRSEDANGQLRTWEVLSKPLRLDGKVVGLIGIARDITERKRAEEALKESDERFSVAFRVNPAPMTISTIDDGVILDVNDRWLSMLGYARDEMIGKETANLPIWLDYKARASFIRKFLKEGFLRGEPVQLRTRNGEIRDTLWSAELVKYRGREVVLSLLYDITERKQAEEKLMEAYRRLDEIIEFLPDATFVINADSKVIAWNRAIEQMTGVSKVEMIGKGEYEYALPFYGERRPIFIDLALRPDTQLENGRYNIARRSADTIYGAAYVPETYGGKGAYLSGGASTLRDAAGNIVGAIESIRDITQLVQTEEALRESEEKYRYIFENSVEGIYQTSREGRVISANRANARILGYESPEELIDTIKDIGSQIYAYPEDRLKVMELLNKDGLIKNFEVQFRHKNGSIVWVILNVHCVRDNQGRILCHEGTIQDITERKRAEEELAKYREGLEQLVAERTQDLEYKTKALEEVNISLKVLLRHREEDKKELEDRFVMNIKKLIMPFAEKIKRTHLDEEQLAYLGIIETHLNDITSSLTKRMHQFNFTPREVEVASLLNEGKTTKEIARIMGIANSSINTHRNQIRKKLGISKKKVNLRSHLQSID
jgi:PAS domain S-box-containing protein